MDIVIEGWHGYKSTDTHQSDMDFEKIKMTPAQVRRKCVNTMFVFDPCGDEHQLIFTPLMM